VADTWRRRRADDSGDIISSWLFQLLIFLAVLSFVAYEAIAVVVTHVGLDDTAREVARAARDEYRVNRSTEVATATAVEVASPRGARVVEVTEDGDDLIVELGRDAPTLVIHRIGPLESLTKVTTSARVAWAQ
jgi:hypothetical protein